MCELTHLAFAYQTLFQLPALTPPVTLMTAREVHTAVSSLLAAFRSPRPHSVMTSPTLPMPRSSFLAIQSMENSHLLIRGEWCHGKFGWYIEAPLCRNWFLSIICQYPKKYSLIEIEIVFFIANQIAQVAWPI